ncbi:Elongation factor Ts [Candidatus Johnevansia muelleri]|uniref:Elongation factor Ts n=1 Tax=Candidatus Johnevansia muelleri TaxID=1495769 RepID=A0A078KE65_9GAMM|nr:Elongation factor Ts [Candidatus Evansia muelleri]
MININASIVKKLRDRTGIGIMECKTALIESKGNIDIAIYNLRKNAKVKYEKKVSRIASEGVIFIKTYDNIAVMLEINSETDFVARSDDFISFTNYVANHVLEKRCNDINVLMQGKLEYKRNNLIQKLGENINVRRLIIRQSKEKQTLGVYLHNNARIGAIVLLNGVNKDVARDISMHVVAMNPMVTFPEEFSKEKIYYEKSIIRAQTSFSYKSIDLSEKIVQARIKKYISENSLVNQVFIKKPDIKVADYAKMVGCDIVNFVRFELGEKHGV